MPVAVFSVDASAILKEAENATSDAAIGLRFGLREIRRHLGVIGQIAIEINDPRLLDELEALCVIKPAP